MRLVRVAKALGMTGQQLRHELSEVNFGIKPTDREIPDNLAQGIVRFVANKHGIEVDMDSLGFDLLEDDEEKDTEDEEEEGEGEEEEEEAPAPQATEKEKVAEQVSAKKEVVKAAEKKEGLHVLRKLALDDVSKEAIKEQEDKLSTERPSKEELDEKRREERAMDSRKDDASGREQVQIKKKEGTVSLPSEVTVKEFAEKTGIQVPQIVQILMKNGVMATINQTIDFDTAAIVASELGVAVQKEQSVATAEDLHTRNIDELLKDEPENLTKRPPVVVIMGHVDHGKTSILDVIRETDVVSGEAGGITQHIGAYQIEYAAGGSSESHKITFLDTPGHEAFTAMRARGAQVTDIAVIVVAADESVKPTTVEAINHAKEAGVPILVAINKIDKEGADPERVKGELAGYELQPEEWGGKTPVVLCSAKTKQGINDLLDAIVLVSEMEELKANPNRSAVATVIESHLDSSLGPLATVIVNTGTLKQGDVFVSGVTGGKVRTMMDAHGEKLDAAAPSGAVRVSGFSAVSEVGDIIQVVQSEQQAKTLLQAMRERGEMDKKRSFVDLVSRLSEGKMTQLKVVLKADSQGSLEAVQEAVIKQSTDEVKVKIIHAAVGAVSESDVMMAAASDGVVVAFHVAVPTGVQKTADREGVEVRKYDIVYALLDDIEGLVKGLVEPEEEEQIVGHLEVKAVFLTKKSQQIVGGKVITGAIKRLPFRVLRNEEEVGTGRITSLKHVEKDIKEAKEGMECGARIETSTLIQEGDVLEVYLSELKKKATAK